MDARRTFAQQLQQATYSRFGKQLPDVGKAEATYARIAKDMAATGWAEINDQDQDQWVAQQLGKIGELPPPPTPYDDPGIYRLLAEKAAQIQATQERFYSAAATWPLLATLPTGQINAMTVRAPGGSGDIIFFDVGLPVFAHMLSKAVVFATPARLSGEDGEELLLDEVSVRKRLEEVPVVLERFSDLVLSYAITGTPARARQYLLPPPHSADAAFYTRAMTLFAVAHEYGHIMHGHLDRAQTSTQRMYDDSGEELNYSWKQEYEADAVGAVLCSLTLMTDGSDSGSSCMGSEYFFSGMDVMQRAVSLLRHGHEDDIEVSSHPPASARRQFLRMQIMPAVLGDARAKIAASYGEEVEMVTKLLWEYTKPRVLEARTVGLTVDPVWR